MTIVATPVPSVITARTNGPLIAAAAVLWIKPTDVLMDPTWGRGNFWVNYQHPGPFIRHDLHNLDGVNVRSLPEPNGSVDVITLDLPYTAKGGRATSTIDDFDDRYGLVDAPRTPADLMELIAAGMTECARVLAPGGRLLVKTMDYVSSGKMVPGLHRVLDTGRALGLEYVDLLVHASGAGPQPTQNRDGTPRRQVHSRRSHSYLVIWKKP